MSQSRFAAGQTLLLEKLRNTKGSSFKMSNMKPISELSPSRQKARLTIFRKRRQKFNLLNGLFNLTVIKDNGVSTVTDANGINYQIHKFFYVGVPAGAKNCEEEGISGFQPFNETIFMNNKKAEVAVSRRLELAKRLADKRANGKKTVRVSIDYAKKEVNGKVYRDVDALRSRDKQN